MFYKTELYHLVGISVQSLIISLMFCQLGLGSFKLNVTRIKLDTDDQITGFFVKYLAINNN